jgi:hypothetical protein
MLCGAVYPINRAILELRYLCNVDKSDTQEKETVDSDTKLEKTHTIYPR